LVPGQDDTENVGALYLDEHLIGTPSIAMGQATRELVRMGQLALSMLDDVSSSFRANNTERLSQAATKETTINNLEQAVVAYLVKVSRQSLSNEQSDRLNDLLSITNEFERIGDHAENIGELAEYRQEHRLPFSDEALAELDDMYGRVTRLVERVVKILDSGDLTQAADVMAGEDDIDQLERSLRRHHISRLNSGTCFPASGVVYLDLISNFERIADHANNTTESLAGVIGN